MSNAIPAEINPKGYGHILDMLEDAVATYGDKPAYTSILQTFTYAQFGQMVDDFSSYLASLEGLEPGDRVMVQMPNLMAAPVTFLSIWKAGFVPVPANPLYTAREIRNVIEDSGAKAIIAFAPRPSPMRPLPGPALSTAWPWRAPIATRHRRNGLSTSRCSCGKRRRWGTCPPGRSASGRR